MTYNVHVGITAGGARAQDHSGVYWLHGDHLGSASLTTNITGAVVSEMRYYPFGETRWVSGTLPTDRLFTGQRAEANIGLYDYNARMYSPSLGRFISADTVVPRAGDSQAFNRYAYARNSPLTRIDPSGHGDCNVHVQAGCHYANDVVPTAYNGNRYGISFSGLWSKWNADTILQSAQIIEKRLMQADISYASRIAHVAREAMSSLCAIFNLNTEGAAWRAVMGSVTISFVAKQATYEGRPYGGEKVFGKNEIRYYPIAFSKNSSLLHNSLHEFGHLYSAHAGENRQPYVDIASAKIVVNGIQIAGGSIRSSYGYASEKGPFQQHPLDSGGEDIADMFMNWSLH